MQEKEPFLLPVIDDEEDFIPILADENDNIPDKDVPNILQILPLRNTVLLPGVIIPITVGRDKSIALIKQAYKKKKMIGVVAQKDLNIEEPEFKDLYTTGTAAVIVRMIQMGDGNTTAIIQGKKRIQLNKLIKTKPFIETSITLLKDFIPNKQDKEMKALISTLKDITLKIIKLSPNIPSEASIAIKNIESDGYLINFIANNNNFDIKEKQAILEESNLKIRAIRTLNNLTKELQELELKNQIQVKARTDINKQQREYFLHQQLKTIQEELGTVNTESEIEALQQKSNNKKWSKETKEKFDVELQKLRRMNSSAPEYSMQLNYVQTMADLPWNEYTKDSFDLHKAQKILDKDHFGLEKVKERIIEYLAVLKLKQDMTSPIICFYGPPGIGKTSLGKSIADSLGRKYVRMSLGGLHDESEIRGHRKTYIGAMPGRIIKNIRKAGSSNPVFVLDEIDKIGKDFHGDPASALLEVLDPEQNNSFYDNYLDLDFDLSKVMFIATANTVNTIHPALLDRMELIDMSGYLLEEKIEIAKKHLVSKQRKLHGLKSNNISFTDDCLKGIIKGYTKESGVRNLEKQIAKVIRYVAKSLALNEPYTKKLTSKHLHKILGPEQYTESKYENNDLAGVVTGLAWTAVGGDILFIEASLSQGKGEIKLTGNLGDVMKESAILALEYLKSHTESLNIPYRLFNEYNVHIHVPEGAIPKDGPSAGVTMFTALASAFTQRKIKSKLAMTGEITLRGKVLPVGGIKEKILAAKRADIKDIILSIANKKDVEDINPLYIKGITFHYIDNMIELINIALLNEKISNPKKL